MHSFILVLKDPQIIKHEFNEQSVILIFHNPLKLINIMDLTTILFILSLPFVLLTVYFGTKNDFYESENYKGDGCAHDVKR